MAEQVTYIINLRDKVTKKLKGINRVLGQTDKTVLNLTRSVASMGAAFGALQVGKKIIQLGVEMEQTRVAFATMLGDVEKGNELIAELNEFANLTPFDNEQVIKSGRILLTTGMAADQVSKTLKSVGDVAAGANVPLSEMSAIYAKAMNKGKVQAEELNQLSERGVPILQTFSQMFGVTSQEVLEMGSKGELTSDKLAEAFRIMTSEGGTFFNLMEKQSKTVGGQFSTLLGKLQTQGIELGERILPSLSKAMSFLLDNFETIIKLLKQGIKFFVIYKASILATSQAVKIATIAHRAYRIASIALSRGIKSVNFALKGTRTALLKTGIGAFAIAIGFVIEKIIAWKEKTKEQREEQDKLNDSLVEFTNNFGTIEEKIGVLGTMNERQVKALQGSIKQQIEASEDITSAQLVELKKRIANDEQLATMRKELAATESKELKANILANIDRRKKEVAQELEIQNKANLKRRRQLNEFLKQTEARLKTLGLDVKITEDIDKDADAQIRTITGAAPKTFNINIEKLVEDFSINTQNIQESASEVKRQMILAFSEALADVQPITD